MKHTRLIRSILGATLLAAGSSHAAIRYVSGTASGINNGTSWTNAYTRLQDALTVAASGDQIWIASGTYKPSTTGDRTQSFNVASGVGLYGGFAGTEATLADRTSAAAATILSGDLLGNDNGNRARTEPTRLDNTYNVVRVSGASATVTFDGLTIQSGHSETYNDTYDRGGGIHFLTNTAGNVVINNCILRWNTARSGAGWADDCNHAFTVSSSLLLQNQTERGGAAGFGAAFTMRNCAFVQNRTENSRDGYQWGGGLFIANATGQVINCIFASNYAEADGGGVYNHGSATFINCAFFGNSAVRWSSALHDRTNSASVRNCIFWGNTGTTHPISADGGSPGTPVYSSLVQGGYTAGGSIAIISGDPLFTNSASPLGPDGLLGTTDDGLRLGTGSPAINAGNNTYVPAGTTTDIAGAVRANGMVDMGAYETGPIITSQPQSNTIVQNAPVSFSVTATGSGTLTYQWQKDGVDVPGATSSTFSLANAKPWHIGDYTVKVTDANGTITSNAATISLTGINSGIWRGLIGFYELDGSGADLSPIARDGANFGATAAADRFGVAGRASSFNGASYIAVPSSPITGRNAFSISFWATFEVQPNGSEGWQVVFGQPATNQGFHIGNRGYGATNMFGSFWSNTTVDNTPFVTLSYNQYFQFVATFDGTKVSIFKNGVLAGSSTQDLSGVNLQPGSLQFGKQLGFNEYFKGVLDSVRIYNRALSANEVQALYASEATVQLAAQPQSLTVAQNTGASFSVTATGVGPLTYQWQKDGVDIPGATSSTFSLASAKPWHIGDYTVKVTDSNGTITSNAATLSLNGINSGIWKGLTAFFPFNGNANDLGVFANSSSVHGPQLIADRLGISQSAYAFCGPLNSTWTSGPSYIEVPDAPALRPAKNLTLSIWAKASLQSFQGYVHMITKRISTLPPGPYNSWAINTPDIGRSTIQYSADNRTIWNSELINGFSVLNGGWQQFVMTVTDTKQALYVDGVLVHQGDVSNSPFTYSAESLLIGTAMKGAAGQDQEWYGALDDIRIYNRAMSGSEVAALYASENAPNNWRQTYFGSTSNTGSAADDADPDRDGLKNLLEYALNLPPNAVSRVTASVQATGGNLEYLYDRSTAAFNGGTSYQVEWSDDLTTWSGAGVVETLLSDDGTTQQVKATLPAGSGGRRFVRLRVQ